jgi:formylmethanofuran dehydrogenase subunit A
MNHYQIAWLEQFLRPAIHLLTPLWLVIRPLLRLATSLTAATVAFLLTTEEGLGIWLALGAGLMSWNFLFKVPRDFAKAVEEIRSAEAVQGLEEAGQDEPLFESPVSSHILGNEWYLTDKHSGRSSRH